MTIEYDTEVNGLRGVHAGPARVVMTGRAWHLGLHFLGQGVGVDLGRRGRRVRGNVATMQRNPTVGGNQLLVAGRVPSVDACAGPSTPQISNSAAVGDELNTIGGTGASETTRDRPCSSTPVTTPSPSRRTRAAMRGAARILRRPARQPTVDVKRRPREQSLRTAELHIVMNVASPPAAHFGGEVLTDRTGRRIELRRRRDNFRPGVPTCGRCDGRSVRSRHGDSVDARCGAIDPPRIATFWADALGYVARAGVRRRGRCVDHRSGGAGPGDRVPQVPEPKTAKNRMHIDIRVAGVPPWDMTERERLIHAKATALVTSGATVVAGVRR